MRTSCPLVKTRNICPKCGADKDIWREVFGEEHHCPESEKPRVETKRVNEPLSQRDYRPL